MARTYDTTVVPGGKSSIAVGKYQAARPSGRVLVNSGFAGEVTNCDKIPLIHQQLWKDASYTNGGAIWLGGGVTQPSAVGKSIPYA